MVTILAIDYTLNPKFPLIEQQNDAVDFILHRTKALVSLQTGCGKTYATLTGLKTLQNKYASVKGIIICPVKAVKIFKKELTGKLGYRDKEVGFITNQEMEYDENNNRVFLFTHTSIEKYGSLIEELSKKNKLVCIFDEAHTLQDTDSKIYKEMMKLKPFLPVIWLSTATPVLNDISSLYNIVAFLDKDFFGGKTTFLNTYTISRLKDIYIKGGKKRKVREITGYKNLDQLKAKLQNICIMRQLKYNLKFANLSSDITTEEEALYFKVSAGIMGDEKVPFSKRMHDLQRVVDNSYIDEFVSCTDSSKEKLLIETLKEVMSKGFSVVVYVDYHDTVDRVEKVLEEGKKEVGYRKVFKITGKIGLQERELVEEQIDERDIVIITSAGSESINLQKANCVIFYDIPYSIKTVIQVIGRICRMDTKFGFQYIMMMYTKNTIDEYKYLLFNENSKLVIAALGSDETMPMNLVDVDTKNMGDLRNRLLWHYKDVGGEEKRKKKRLLRANIYATTGDKMKEVIAEYYISLNPEDVIVGGTKRLPEIALCKKDYDEYLKGVLPLAVMRVNYSYSIKSESSLKAIKSIMSSVLDKKKSIAFVDDFGLAKILKDFIVESVE